MKVLILVLSARRSPWDSLMDVSQQTWDSEDNPQTQTLYYCGKSTEPSTEKVFYSQTLTEELEDVSSRTIEAFEKALTIPDWDYLARPNSSCYVHKPNLVKFCETLPKDNVLYGLLTGGGKGKQMLWGGGQYIISRDVVQKMVDNKDKWNHDLMDDVSLTRMAEELDISMESKGYCASINLLPDGSYFFMAYGTGDNSVFTKFEDMKADNHYFFRCKHDPDRTVDLKVMRELKKHLP